jgi:hypothetical protein
MALIFNIAIRIIWSRLTEKSYVPEVAISILYFML